jgi:hypothetical protein
MALYCGMAAVPQMEPNEQRVDNPVRNVALQQRPERSESTAFSESKSAIIRPLNLGAGC